MVLSSGNFNGQRFFVIMLNLSFETIEQTPTGASYGLPISQLYRHYFDIENFLSDTLLRFRCLMIGAYRQPTLHTHTD